jgi:hypothetical protein
MPPPGIRISREGIHFRIRLEGDRSRYTADDAREAANAVLHYYGAAGECGMTGCPLCRAIAKQNQRTRERS